MKHSVLVVILVSMVSAFAVAQSAPQVKIADGTLEGVDESGVYAFKGIPFAAPPVGDYRWREPQPVQPWTGIRKADHFGPRAMQRPLFSDMNFRSDGMSEDCLYLNVWTPAKEFDENLPVLVYFYGGGLVAGDGSEFRYDGEAMARRGIVTVTVNYRLSIFGFFSHPELSKESPFGASGNYGLLDQYAALKWVQQNISAFGGNPNKVTIAGESAGSFSVSAQMASPLSKSLFHAAIGESGSLLGNRPIPSLETSETRGSTFADAIGASSLAALRAMPAEELLAATTKPEANFGVNIDGHFFTKNPVAVFEAGEQAQVPLLAGWNSQESDGRALLGNGEPTVQHFSAAVRERFGDDADALLQVYSPANDAEVEQTATDLAGDQFIGYSTWRWIDLHSQTGGHPVYRYYYARPRPATREGGTQTAKGAVHSAEIEYALGNLSTNRVFDWQPEDAKVSAILQNYFVNFVQSHDPNGLGVPFWPTVEKNQPATVMHIDVETKAETELHRNRYLKLQEISQ